MTRVMILGSNGFVGSKLSKFLFDKYHVYPITREVLDLLDYNSVTQFLSKNSIDVVLNCAASMKDSQSVLDARNNLGIFMNFYHNSDLFGKFINTGSGAELDRRFDLYCANESLLFERMPIDSYGWGQNIKSRLCFRKENFYTIRIFNCFGNGEVSTRVFPQFLHNENFSIKDDRYFDYFSIQDLCLVVDHCIKNTWKIKDINAVYDTKYKTSQVIERFCKINNFSQNYKVTNSVVNNYTGCHKNLYSLGIDLKGLEHGLASYFTGEV
jgi:nucleoside-diphosphate-sugar epimerase